VIILDEPTSVLTPAETERLYGFIKSLAAEDKAVVLITHKLADVAACADRITIMRGGKVVDRATKCDRSSDALVEAMVGVGSLGHLDPPAPMRGNLPILRVRNLAAEVQARTISSISFELAEGEIFGIAGVSGNGQFVLAEALAGLVPVTDGDVVLAGTSIASHSDDGAIAADVAYIPERPLDNAVVPDIDLCLNLALRTARDLAFFPSRRNIEDRASRLISDYDVRPPQSALLAAALSGGNLQKLVIAREFSGRPRLVISQPHGESAEPAANLQYPFVAQVQIGSQVPLGHAVPWGEAWAVRHMRPMPLVVGIPHPGVRGQRTLIAHV